MTTDEVIALIYVLMAHIRAPWLFGLNEGQWQDRLQLAAELTRRTPR